MSDLVGRRYQLDADIGDLVIEQANNVARQQSESPVVVLESTAIHRFQIESNVESHRYLCDEPIKGGGSDIAPAPLRYFAGSILQCLEVWILKHAALERMPLTGLSGRIVAYLEKGAVGVDNLRSTDTPSSGRGFERFVITIKATSAWDETKDELVSTIVARAMRGCPASATTARIAKFEVTVDHNGREFQVAG